MIATIDFYFCWIFVLFLYYFCVVFMILGIFLKYCHLQIIYEY